MSGKLLLAATLAAVVIAPIANQSTAFAQSEDDKKAALAAYKKGTIQYNLGNWDEAIKFFKQAFETYPDAAFLFNIAQSYRQAGDCKQSAFFYRRYLAIKPDAPNRREVEGFIVELDAQCQSSSGGSTGGSTTPPDNGGTPPDTGTGGTTTGTTTGNTTGGTPPDTSGGGTPPDTSGGGTPPDTTSGQTSGGSTAGTGGGTQVAEGGSTSGGGVSGGVSVGGGGGSLLDEGTAPKLVKAYAAVGPNFLLGVGDLETAAQANFTVGAGYPVMASGPLVIDAGLVISYNPVNWSAPSASGTAAFTGILASGAATYEVAPKVHLRGEGGFGMMLYSGLDILGNVFVQDNMQASGTLTSPALRLAAGAEYDVLPNLVASVRAGSTVGLAAPTGMREGIDSLSTFQILLGAGFKL